jgi:Tfp pilus assembly protein PilO
VNRRAHIFVGVGFAVVIAICVFLFVLPKSGQISEAENDLATARQQETSLRFQLNALQEAQAEAPQTKRRIQAVENQVPSTADLPALIRLLREAADRSAVDLFQFSPNTPLLDPSGQYSTISTAVNVTGSYFSLQEFLYRLESLPRAAKVTNVSISPSGTTARATTTTTTATTATQLNMQLTVEFYTSDISAGPGSAPGPTGATTGA